MLQLPVRHPFRRIESVGRLHGQRQGSGGLIQGFLLLRNNRLVHPRINDDLAHVVGRSHRSGWEPRRPIHWLGGGIVEHPHLDVLAAQPDGDPDAQVNRMSHVERLRLRSAAYSTVTRWVRRRNFECQSSCTGSTTCLRHLGAEKDRHGGGERWFKTQSFRLRLLAKALASRVGVQPKNAHLFCTELYSVLS